MAETEPTPIEPCAHARIVRALQNWLYSLEPDRQTLWVGDLQAILDGRPGFEADPRVAAWDEAAEAVADWMSTNPSPSGIPHDPPRNPYAKD